MKQASGLQPSRRVPRLRSGAGLGYSIGTASLYVVLVSSIADVLRVGRDLTSGLERTGASVSEQMLQGLFIPRARGRVARRPSIVTLYRKLLCTIYGVGPRGITFMEIDRRVKDVSRMAKKSERKCKFGYRSERGFGTTRR